jgi:tetratricopeptide (TPR) repeat protein
MSLLLAHGMPVLLRGQKWKELLLQMHRRRPDDFWINYELSSDPSPPADRLRFSTAAVALRPDNAGARVALGEALHRLGRLDEAMIELNQAIQLRPESFSGHAGLANVLHEKRLLDEAIAEYRQALRLAPDVIDRAHTHLRLSGALADKGLAEEALAEAREAVRIRPLLWSAHVGLGRALLLQGKIAEAVTCFRKASKLDRSLPQPHLALGMALQQQGDWRGAAAAFGEALRLQPGFAAAQSGLAWLLATCPQPELRDPARAVELAGKAVKVQPQEGTWWNTLGVAQYRAGDWKAALAALERSMELRQGGDPNDWLFQAMTQWQLGEKDRARQWYARAVAWMDTHKPQAEELKRFRAEAAELLGLEEHPRQGREVLPPPTEAPLSKN